MSVLSAKKVERIKDKGRYGDGEVRGFYLQVSPTGRSPGCFATSSTRSRVGWASVAWSSA